MKKRTTFKEDLEVFGKVKVLTLTAMLVAMSVVIGILCKNFLTWNIYYRFTLENLPIFFAAIAFGPFIGAAAGVLADLVSCLCSTKGIGLLFTLSSVWVFFRYAVLYLALGAATMLISAAIRKHGRQMDP